MARLFGAGAVYDAFLLGHAHPQPRAQSLRRGRALVGIRPGIHAISQRARAGKRRQSFECRGHRADSDGRQPAVPRDMIFSPAARAPDGAGFRGGAGQVRTRGAAHPDHVSVSAAGGSWRRTPWELLNACDRLRRARARLDLLQCRIGDGGLALWGSPPAGFRNTARSSRWRSGCAGGRSAATALATAGAVPSGISLSPQLEWQPSRAAPDRSA